MAMPDQPTEWRRGRRAAERPRFTGEQLAAFRRAWADFADPAWQPFRRACMERGFLPPQGTDEDDPDTSLRSKLWRIADDRPNDLGRWAAESPGADLYAVVADVFNRYGAIRTDAGVDDQEWIQAKAEERAAAKRSMGRVGELIAGVGTEPGAPGVGELRAENEVLRTGRAGAGQMPSFLVRVDFPDDSSIDTDRVAHVHFSLFVGPDQDHRAFAGSLVLRPSEFLDFCERLRADVLYRGGRVEVPA